MLVSAAFLVGAALWLRALRAAAIDRRMGLTWLDKFLAAFPVGYTVAIIVLAGVLMDELEAVFLAPSGTQQVPFVGQMGGADAAFFLLVFAAACAASPLVVIRTVERHFTRKLPEMTQLARRAVFATLMGVEIEEVTERAAPAPPLDDEEEWRRLLRRSRRG